MDDDLLRRIHAGEPQADLDLTRSYGRDIGSFLESTCLEMQLPLTDDELEQATCLVLRIVCTDIRKRPTIDDLCLPQLVLECTRQVTRLLQRFLKSDK
jgi:hypothetical protein